MGTQMVEIAVLYKLQGPLEITFLVHLIQLTKFFNFSNLWISEIFNNEFNLEYLTRWSRHIFLSYTARGMQSNIVSLKMKEFLLIDSMDTDLKKIV